MHIWRANVQDPYWHLHPIQQFELYSCLFLVYLWIIAN